MIRDRIVVERYAEAFLKSCRGSIGLEKAISDLKKVRKIIEDSSGLQELLESPEIAYVDKCDIISKVMDSDLSDEVRNLLKLLIENRRIKNFTDIASYAIIKYSNRGQEVLLRMSYPLETDMIKRIKDKIEEKFKKRFKFFIELDDSLLGGIQVVVGNKVFDGSVRRRLDDLKELMKTVQVPI